MIKCICTVLCDRVQLCTLKTDGWFIWVVCLFCLTISVRRLEYWIQAPNYNNAQWDSSVGFLKSYFFECKSGRNSIKVAEKWT